jgi:Rhodanese-like domain
MRNAKLDLDTIEALVSSKVIGVLGTIMNPTILFHKGQTIGAFSTVSRDYILLSHMGDYFAAGIEYANNSDDITSPLTAEPHEYPRTSSPMEAIQKVESFISLPGNVSLFPLNEIPSRGTSQSQQVASPKTPVRPPPNEPESPSFFSPSFADHLTSSNRHDPRIHTINIPFHLNAPQRAQTYPTTPSPARSSRGASQFSLNSRSSSALRSARRTSEIPTTNLLAIQPHELVDLLNSAKKLLVLDIRAFAAYAKSRVRGAINVCIPTVLLKRPSLKLDDVSGSISESDRGRFANWKEAEGIVIYDTDSLRVKEAYPLATLAAKFLEAGYEQPTYGITGDISPPLATVLGYLL